MTVAALVIALLLCVGVGLIARNLGRSFVIWFIVSLLLSPLITVIIVLIMGYKRRCPKCQGKISPKATRCRHCTAELGEEQAEEVK